jgi:hypothetical protein
MADETGKGAWMMRKTIGGDGESEWEKYWDPDATPLSENEERARHNRILELLFKPRPDDPR